MWARTIQQQPADSMNYTLRDSDQNAPESKTIGSMPTLELARSRATSERPASVTHQKHEGK